MKKTMILFTLMAFASLPVFAEVKIATIDLAKIFENYSRAKTAEASIASEGKSLSAESMRRQSEGRAIAAQIDGLIQKYNNPALSQAARDAAKKEARDLEDKMDQKKDDFEKFMVQARQTMAQKEQAQHDIVLNEIRRATTAVAHRDGISVVLNAAPDLPVVIYSEPRLDITNAVLATLNAGAK